MLLSVLILAVLVVAVGVLVYTSPARESGISGPAIAGENGGDPLGENGIRTIDRNGDNGENGDNGNGPGDPNGDGYPPNGDPVPRPPELERIEIRRHRDGNTPVVLPQSDGIPDVTMRVGERLNIVIIPHPAAVDLGELDIEWTSNNTDAFGVTPVSGEPGRATLRATGRTSRSTLTVTVGDITQTMIVRVGS